MSSASNLPRVGPQRNLFSRNPKEVCAQIGLQWFAAMNLYADGYLSVSPDIITDLDDGQEAELLFVGTLAVWANDHVLLDRLLLGLQKPYCYRLDQIWYDWRKHEWQAFPEPEETDPETVLNEWLDTLASEGNIEQLRYLKEQIETTIEGIP